MQVCLELNKRLADDPSYPIPEGYSKGIEKIPIYDYSLPESIAQILPESKAVSIETLDGIFHDIFNFHIIEPLVTIEERPRVRPRV
jgi:hypothetical protein